METLAHQETGNLRQPMSPAARIYHHLILACGTIAAFLIGLMAILVCLDVGLRNLTNNSISWSVEMTEYMLMVAAFLAAPWLAYTNDHIRVDVLVRNLSERKRKMVAAACNVICLAISVTLAFESTKGLIGKAEQGSMVFKVLTFPEWWLSLPMVICFCLLSIEFIRRLFTGESVAQGAA